MSWSLKVTGAAALATVLASLSLFPAYDGQQWLWASLVTIAFVGAVGLGLRQLGTPRFLVPLGQLAALGWAFILLCANEGLKFGFLPTGEAVQILAERINDGLLIVVRFAPPVPYDADLVVVTALGIGLVAIAVDTLAVTVKLVPWAGLPLLLLYSIPATTVSGGVSALAFVPAAVGYIVLLMSEGRDRLSHWGRIIGFREAPTAQDGVQTSLLGQTGRRVGAAVIGLAVIVPALIPALPEGVFGTGSGPGFGKGNTTIRVNNPVLDLKRNLNLPQNIELMQFTTNYPDNTSDPWYIRLVVLDQFTNGVWSPSQRSVQDVQRRGGNDTGQLPRPPGLDASVPAKPYTFAFEVSKLDSKWLPLPYPASTIEAPGTLRYDSGTLDVVTTRSTAGLSYKVDALNVNPTAEDLNRAGAAPEDIEKQYTELPGDIPDKVRQLANQIVTDAGATTTHERAVALQNWFRSEFTYDTTVRTGHSGSELMDFLNDKRGYCEQFSATMAIMARALGIPARVAVGYLPGVAKGNTYTISAHDAHAWTEIYFAGYGWLAFEPTPSGRAPFTPRWAERFDPQETPTTGPSSDLPTTDPSFTGGPVGGDPEDPLRGPNGIPIAGPASGGPPAGLIPALIVIGVFLLLATPGVSRLLMRRSRLRRPEPDRLAEGAWNELADTMIDLGLPWNEAATPRATGQRLSNRVPASGHAALDLLVRAVERARYSRNPGDLGDVRGALSTLTSALRAGTRRGRVVVAAVFPPSLWRQARQVSRLFGWLVDGWDTVFHAIAGRLRRVPQAVSHREQP